MIDQAELHVFVHVGLFEAFACDAVSKEYAWLNVNVVTPESLFFKAVFVEIFILLSVFFGDIKVIKSLMKLFLAELEKLFESDSLKRRAISFLLVKDEDLFAFHLGEVCG